MKDAYLPTFYGYHCLWQNRFSHGVGGVCILIHQSLCFQEIRLNPFQDGVLEIQAIKVRLGSGSFLSVLNLYNPNAAVTHAELLHYTDQLDPPFLLTGDFNAHSPLLSSACSRADAAGRSLEQLLLSTPLTLLNEIDFYTYIDRRTGRCSCLDLVLVSSDVSPCFHLERLRDVGSDHYPILASSSVHLHTLTSILACTKMEAHL